MKEIPTIEIVAVGTELLSPFFLDTNSLYITGKINDIGLSVSYKTVVGDERTRLCRALETAVKRSDWVLVTGGLGPTDDDRTREAAAEIFGRRLLFQEDLLKRIQSRFLQRGLVMPSSNKKQAYIIEGFRLLNNDQGTAPGLWMEENGRLLFLLPGPPHEMKAMFDNEVFPLLKTRTNRKVRREVLKIVGLAESRIEDMISDLYKDNELVSITTLARPGQIEIHLSEMPGPLPSSSAGLDTMIAAIEKRLYPYVFSCHGEELEEVIGNLLNKAGKTIAVAESCTGGFLAHRITSVPGSSKYFLYGIISYSNQAKISLLGVKAALIEKHGAVSVPVAKAMAEGILHHSGADYGLAVTGIAGPHGGSQEKPVGLVYTALAPKKGKVLIEENHFLGSRDNIKFQSSQRLLDMLRKELLQI